MDCITALRKEVYEPLGEILKNKGDDGFISEGPKLLKTFYDKNCANMNAIESDHAEYDYTRKRVICENGLHAIRCMEWAPGASSAIHEHGGRPCFDIVLEGELEIIDYFVEHIEGEKYNLTEIKRYSAQIGDLVIVNPIDSNSEVHTVVNGSRRSRSLHCYPIDHQSLGVYTSEGDYYVRSECTLATD